MKMKCYKESIKYISNEVIDDIHSVYQVQLYVQQVQQLHPQRYHEGGAHYRHQQQGRDDLIQVCIT